MFDKLKVLRYIKKGQRFSYLFGFDRKYDIILNKATDREIIFASGFDYNLECEFSSVDNLRRPSLVFRNSNVNVVNTEFFDDCLGNFEFRNFGGTINFMFDDIKKHFEVDKNNGDSLNDCSYKANNLLLLKSKVNAETVGIYGYDGDTLSLLDCNFHAANIIIDGCSSMPFSAIDNINAYSSISIKNSNFNFPSNIALTSNCIEIKDSNIKASGIKLRSFGSTYLVDTKVVSSSDMILDCGAELSMEEVTASAQTDLDIKASKARIFESVNKSSSNIRYSCGYLDIDVSKVEAKDGVSFDECEIDIKNTFLIADSVVMNCPDNEAKLDKSLLSVFKMVATLKELNMTDSSDIIASADGCDIAVKKYENDGTCMDASFYGVKFIDDEAWNDSYEDSYGEKKQSGVQYKKSLF